MEKLLEKICNFNKSPEQDLSAYKHFILSNLEKQLDVHDVRNKTDIHHQHAKYLQVFHNHSGQQVLCSVFVLADKTVRVEFNNLALIPSHFKYKSLAYAPEIVKRIVNTILVIENKGDYK